MHTAHIIAAGDRLRIMLFMFDLAPSGVTRNGVRLANALAARGHDVHLTLGRETGRSRQAIHPDVNIVVLPEPLVRAAPRTMAMILQLGRLRRAIRTVAPDVLVSLGNHGHLPILIASTALLVNRLYRISNDLDHPGEARVVGLLRRASTALIVRTAQRLMLVSAHLQRHSVFRPARDADRLDIVPNGVAADDVVRLAAAPCPHRWLEDGPPTIVAMGRLARQKNYPVLLRALAHANAERPVRLLIIGGGPARARERLRRTADELGLADRVDLVGSIDNPFAFIGRASAFVLPSLWEGSSNALLEALACGAPVIAARTAGSAQEVLGYGRFGLVVDPFDAEALAHAILLQTGPDPCLPGNRAWDFDADHAIEGACAAIIATAGRAAVRPEAGGNGASTRLRAEQAA